MDVGGADGAAAWPTHGLRCSVDLPACARARRYSARRRPAHARGYVGRGCASRIGRGEHQQRQLPQLRNQNRRHTRLLGPQQLRSSHPTRGHLHRYRGREFEHLRDQSSGSLVCWGYLSGQGPPPSGNFAAVATGELHSCAIRTYGALACWGDNNQGEATPPFGTFAAVAVATARQPHPREPFPPSALTATPRARSERTVGSRVGAATSSAKPLRP
jgi:hypothetical protein